MERQEAAIWMMLCETYKLIGGHGYAVTKQLIDKNQVQSTELLRNSKMTPSKFYQVIHALVFTQVADKHVKSDRSVWYSLSPFGKNMLQLSVPLLDEIRKHFKDKKSILLDRKWVKETYS